jgi:heptosyltransferase-2
VADILIIKTGALGDVLRSTSILPGLAETRADARITWITAPMAWELVAHHPQVDRVLRLDPGDPEQIASIRTLLSGDDLDWIISLDDESSLCELASSLAAPKLTGACMSPSGVPGYSEDAEAWFGMGLLAREGKAAADARKLSNRRSHPEILADMLSIPMGRPELPLPDSAQQYADAFLAEHALPAAVPMIGLNTGAGGRWPSKELPLRRVVETAESLHGRLQGQVSFLLLGGPEERSRNQAIMREIAASSLGLQIFDAGCDHAILDFAAIVARCNLLLTSDSLAMHLAIAARVPIVAFFAPTSAAEIELYGLGEKVSSTAADYCSYRPDADNSTITAQRLSEAILRVLQ